jgi:hypothetical protein
MGARPGFSPEIERDLSDIVQPFQRRLSAGSALPPPASRFRLLVVTNADATTTTLEILRDAQAKGGSASYVRTIH